MSTSTKASAAVTREYKWPFTRQDPLLPAPDFDEARASGGVTPVRLWNDSQAWMATRHEDIRNLLRNPAMSANSSIPGYPNSSANHEASRGSQRGFIRMDGAEHLRQRRMVARALSVPEVAKLRPFVERVVDLLLDRMAELGADGAPVDFLTVFAEPLPSIAICEILGLPESEGPGLLDMVNRWMDLDSPPAVSAAAAAEMTAYLDDLVQQRIKNPTDDLVGKLVTEQLEAGNIENSGLLGILNLLIVGGFDTTANMLALGTILLLRHPDQAAMLRADEGLATSAIEEMLRYLSVAHHVASRVATEDVAIRDQVIPAGSGILAPVPAANHDPEVFTDPHRFDITRDARDHVAFGFGIHQCLGQNLARLELQVAFTRLLKRFPNLALAVPEGQIEFRNSMIYGVKALPITW
ncbi:cytochrome P450 [Microbacterium suwonense]|uniref:Cytochrome P450 n=1 Tax=Microbacterium suwonense TaxID=683047 RepID=A0ABN6X423_9MICO|nr:cytochrome P450 [Microbacterium suwonense]BDZ39309.1 cytochrome P450 [Microbacterium suwonense]